MTIVTKKDIFKKVIDTNKDIPAEDLTKAMDTMFSEISTALICGDRIELRGFGSFVVRKRKAGIRRNPKTKDKIEVGPKGSLYFRASKGLLGNLNSDKDSE